MENFTPQDWADECHMSRHTDGICDAISIAISDAMDEANVPDSQRDRVRSILHSEFDDWF